MTADSVRTTGDESRWLLRLLTAAVGLGVGVYAGLLVVVPLIGAVIAAVAAMKLLPADKQFIVPAVAVQAGHLFWFWAGAILAGTVEEAILVDVIVLSIGLVWLVAAPGYRPVVVLAAFQAMATWVNADALLAAEWGTMHHKGLLVHLALRFLALIYLGCAALVHYTRRHDGQAD